VSIATRRKNIVKNTHEYFDEKKKHYDEKKITAFCYKYYAGGTKNNNSGNGNECAGNKNKSFRHDNPANSTKLMGNS